nr:uncharacterized protein LOC111429476 [Onthophagus taurus]
MYRQILITPADRIYQYILWRFSPDEPIQIYQLNTVTYGIASAPFLALRTILELSNLYSEEYSQASHVLKHNVYVDDIVTGANSIQEILVLQRDLIELLRQGGFKLRKWASNCSDVLESVSQDDLQPPLSLDPESNCIKILGLQWDPTKDVFKYHYSPRSNSITKRHILSDIARIYDPLGFLTPCTFKAKHIIQQLWQLQCDWDEIPPDYLVNQWKSFKQQLSLLSNFELPRFISSEDYLICELHLFCDASEIGYATCAYLRYHTIDNSIRTYFIGGKSRVAPLKTITIPRLELCGATLLVDFLETIQPILTSVLKIKSITAWSDSQVVLHWLNSVPNNWKTFVANRVAHIQNILPANCWRYVPSAHNPSDCASRGLNPEQLLNSDIWWHGPRWFLDHDRNWPNNPCAIPNEKINLEKRALQRERELLERQRTLELGTEERQMTPTGNMSQLLPEFDPDKLDGLTAPQWIQKVEHSIDSFQWNHNIVLFNAISMLRGAAKLWFEGYRGSLSDWLAGTKLLLIFLH